MRPRIYVRTSVRPSVRPSVRRSVEVIEWKNERFGYFLFMFVYGVGFGVWMGVGCPCPPVRNDIVTPCHLLFFKFENLPQVNVMKIKAKAKDKFVS